MIEILHKNNIKVTKPRLKIYNSFKENNKLTLKEILNNNLDIDKSTVYRIIDLFLKKQIIFKIINNDTIYYKLNNSHTHYLECSLCHKKDIIEKCPYNAIDLNGFLIKEKEVINGICKECQNSFKRGIFVGSFNPPTNTHFEIGHYLYKNNYLDEIVYVPCNSLSKKDLLIDINDRYNMISLYVNKYNYLKVNDIEIKNGSNNFSYHDLDLLKQEYNSPLYIILGADNLSNLYKWDNYQYMIKNYDFIVLNRFNLDVKKIIKDKYQKYIDKFIIIDYYDNLSSTIVRESINNKEVVKMIPKEIYQYIKENDLYKK